MFMYEIFIGILSLIMSFRNSASIDDKSFQTVQNYLFEYGYLETNGWNSTDATFINALKLFQRYTLFKNTGRIDKNIIAMTYIPRCAEPDFSYIRRQKRFGLIGSKWNNNKTVTYKVINYPNNFTENEVHRELLRATKLWSDGAPLRFSPKRDGPTNIDITFEKIDGHGDRLCKCDAPRYTGTLMTFDIDEPWTIDTPFGLSLLYALTHCIGHAIGLKHSEYPHAIMRPFLIGYKPIIKLHPDDINGAEFLYGPRHLSY